MLDWMLEKSKQGRGGGGKPRIRFGNTGPRGRQYGKAGRGTVAIAKNKYIKAGKGSRAAIREHLRYIQERERGEREPERKFFDRDRDGIERAEVYQKMLENRGDRTAMHTLILSPGDNSIDIRDYTRESMKALEERMGHNLDWYATIHENTDHYHAHVVIAGKVPGWEREVERREAKNWEREWNEAINREFSWKNQEAELRALLGERYDEKAGLDPREERRAERQFGYGSEREETDPRVAELLGDRTRSVEELRAERLLDRYERQMAARESAQERGDVFLDVNDLRELRAAGNDYVNRERSLERSLERAYEREFGRELDRDLDRDRDREMSREPERSGLEDMMRMWEADRELSREQERTYDDRGRSRGGDEDEQRGRDRDRGDDFGRGR
jgi:hypothetical protein